jgi:hypothetical protein
MIHAQNFSLGVNLMFKVIPPSPPCGTPHYTIPAASRQSSKFLCHVLTSRRRPDLSRSPHRSQILSVKTLTSRLSRGEYPLESCLLMWPCGLFFHGEQKIEASQPLTSLLSYQPPPPQGRCPLRHRNGNRRQHLRRREEGRNKGHCETRHVSRPHALSQGKPPANSILLLAPPARILSCILSTLVPLAHMPPLHPADTRARDF